VSIEKVYNTSAWVNYGTTDVTKDDLTTTKVEFNKLHITELIH
jgi:hypothetical protein